MRPTFAALAAAAFVSGANLRLFDALLPDVAGHFAVSPTTASIVVTAFTVAYGLFQIVHGPLGDRIGKLRTIAFAMLIAAAGSLGSALAPSLKMLAALRFLTGIGAAAIIPLTLAWLADHTPYERRQATLGRFIGIVLIGQILGPALGGSLSHWMSWREVFYVLATVFAMVSVVIFAAQRRAIDAPAGPAPRVGVLRGYAAVIGDAWVRTVLVAVCLEGALFYGAFAYTGAYLRQRFALSFVAIGILLALFGAGGVLYSLTVKWLLARLREAGLVHAGALILLACYLALPLLPDWRWTVPVFFAAGLGFYMFHNTLQTRATEMAPQSRGTAIAVFALSLFLGQAAGVVACGAAIDAFGYGWSFSAAGLALLALGRWFSARVKGHRAAQ